MTTFADTTTAPGKTYSYEVRARDAAGNVSPPSNAASIAVPIPDTTAPGAPSGLSAQVAAGGVTLTWLAASDNVGVTNYEILRNGATLATVGAVTTFTDTTTAPGTTYSYQVRARDAAGNLSAPSSVVTVAIAPSGGNTTTPTVLSQVLRPEASAPKPRAATSGQSTAGRATTALTGGATGLLARTGIIALGAGAALLVAGTGSCYEPKHRGRRRRRGRH